MFSNTLDVCGSYSLWILLKVGGEIRISDLEKVFFAVRWVR